MRTPKSPFDQPSAQGLDEIDMGIEIYFSSSSGSWVGRSCTARRCLRPARPSRVLNKQVGGCRAGEKTIGQVSTQAPTSKNWSP